MITTTANEFLDSIDRTHLTAYRNYWTAITPATDQERFKRWLFAYASVHSSWENNVRMYEAIKDCTWIGNQEELLSLIRNSGAGLHNNRTRFIMDFTTKYWDNPSLFTYDGDDWLGFRSKIDNNILGLGRAKIAFALEMIHPEKMKLLCADTHLLQLFGFTASNVDKCKPKEFETIENHWVSKCNELSIPPALARLLFWDKKQGKLNSRYWSYVLEADDIKQQLNEMEVQAMQLKEAKEEFVDKVSKIIVPMTVVPKVDLPASVGDLVKWFMTADYSQLTPHKLDNNWSVVSTTGDEDNKSGMKLTCKYIKDIDGPLAVRPYSSPVVLLNKKITLKTVTKVVWDMLIQYKDQCVKADLANTSLSSVPIRYICEYGDIIQLKIDKATYLYVPHVNVKDNADPAIFDSGILTQCKLDPEAMHKSRGDVNAFGPLYLSTVDSPLLQYTSETERAYASQIEKLLTITILVGRVQATQHLYDADGEAARDTSLARYAEAIKAYNPVAAHLDSYQVMNLCRNQLNLCYNPKSPVSFMGLIDPVQKIGTNGSIYTLEATAMINKGKKVYVTGDVVVKSSDGVSFEKIETEPGEWYEVQLMPGIKNETTNEEEV